MAPLFVASVLMVSLGVVKVLLNQKAHREHSETANERVARLQREEQREGA